MLVLHGSWMAPYRSHGACFVLWGEDADALAALPNRRRRPADPDRVRAHPFAAPSGALRDALRVIRPGAAISTDSTPLIVRLPSAAGLPLPSPSATTDDGRDRFDDEAPAVAPWRVDALMLDVDGVLASLPSLTTETAPAGVDLGEDVQFWIGASRVALDLLYRQKFFPTIQREKRRYAGRWRPLLDDFDEAKRFGILAGAMPAACRAPAWRLQAPVPGAGELLMSFLDVVVDTVARQAAGSVRPLAGYYYGLGPAWLNALGGEPFIDSWVIRGYGTYNAYEQYEAWARAADVMASRTEPFRICFALEPPPAPASVDAAAAPGSAAAPAGAPPPPPDQPNESAGPASDDAAPEQSMWTLRFMVQATDDPSLLLPAEEVWRGRGEAARFLARTGDDPRSRLLSGLARASVLAPVIAPGLHTPAPACCSLTTRQAYEFLAEQAPSLKEHGFGVLLPGLEMKLGLRLRLGRGSERAADGGLGMMGLDAVVNFDWQLALGGEPMTREEFERLAALKEPLVQVRGRWVELRPEVVEQALAFFKKQDRRGRMSIPEALRLALAPDGEHGIAIEEVDTAGWFDDLLQRLRDGGGREQVEEPDGFVGELRGYQKTGVSWLATLRRYGLGACLADDMGLGKCLRGDSRLLANGMPQRADALWDSHRRSVRYDGEGYWAEPSAPLLVNAIDRATGRIVQVPIRRMYRQHVREKLRTVTLEDGSSITVTRRHKLLTDKGWTNELRAGDYVCVPAKLMWDGEPVDPDLVTFLAWQIAEGYEIGTYGSFNITQKDPERLRELLCCFERIGERYNLKINHPVVGSNGKGCYQLRASSIAYRRFLTEHGYQWGKRSRDKAIPDFIMQAELDSVRSFLRNYFEAEAPVTAGMRSIEISSASSLLMKQLSVLLRRFGIWMRLSTKQKHATNGSGIDRTYHIGVIGGNSARRFLDEIGFISTAKQRRLEEICARVSNTNVEGIPASGIVAEMVHTTGLPLRHFGMHNTVYINGSQQFSRESLGQVVANIDRVLSGESEQRYRQQKPSRWTARTLDAYARLDVSRVTGAQRRFRQLLDQEVFYCRIASVEDVDHEGWVYDFEVDQHHNFVAENILCHNTVEVAAALLHAKEHGTKQGPALIICPTSVVGNWRHELARFAPELRVLVHHGADRNRETFAEEAARHDVVISSYALLHRDEAALTAVPWSDVVLDEAQNIKNPSTKAAQTARRLPAGWRAALTGTPVENRLSDLWSIFQFLNPGYLGAGEDFRKRFAGPIERGQDADAAAQLRTLVSPFILRRVKTDRTIIADLPEKNEMKVYCTLTKEQATLYQAVVKDSLRRIAEADGLERRGIILATLTKLKQVCDHPALFLHDGSRLSGRSGKLARLTEMLEEVLAVDERALVFTQFAEMGKLLKEHLEKAFGREVLFLYGDTPAPERDRMVAAFQQDTGGPPIFVLSIKAGGTGLNLTRANHVFHVDRWWNPAVENQATDRAFRIGQRRDVQVHKFICAGTLEDAIDQLIERKVEISEAVVGTSEAWLTEMSTEQLRDLLLLRRDALED